MKSKLTRKGRSAVNLALAVTALYLIWGMAGYPLGYYQWEHRRLERAYLLEPSEEVARIPTRIGDNEVTLVISTAEEYVAVGLKQAVWGLDIHPIPAGEPALVTLYTGRNGGRGTDTAGWLLAVHVPKEAAEAELALDVTGDYERSYRMEGKRLLSGDFLFTMECVDSLVEGGAEWREEQSMWAALFSDPSERSGTWDFSVRAVFRDVQGREVCEITSLEQQKLEIRSG